ncbi:hypothetical protein [Dishui Lake virophage 2]|nr:hypothetical protein [Dishui Lake virophage 2]
MSWSGVNIIELINSPKSNKRFRIVFEEDDEIKTVDFGSPVATTFIDGAPIEKRDNYRKRHLANKTEKHRIENLIPSPALFAYWILWGDSQDIIENIIQLQKALRKKA